MTMRRFLSGLLASALAFAVTATGLLPAQAAPTYVPRAGVEASGGEVIQVQDSRRWRREGRHDRRYDRRHDRRGWRHDRREVRRDHYRHRPGYYRGYRGYRAYRPGYRRYNDGFWYPAGAFIAGAIIGGAIANSPPVVREGGSHVQWCYNRYRSYRASDNTFQPNSGPRRQCISPYS